MGGTSSQGWQFNSHLWLLLEPLQRIRDYKGLYCVFLIETAVFDTVCLFSVFCQIGSKIKSGTCYVASVIPIIRLQSYCL